ncbi:MAG TPA: MATE family efflux transporter [Candidatus Aminicenantes bacterium]|nr:MATE family efflux transporter [Candidatus Aminicenantes bacterium]
MANANRVTLVAEPVGRTLVQLTWPMIVGHLGMVAFNLADTFYVGRLGTRELAAMSFTFPVVMAVSSLAIGLGIGTAAVVSRAIGEGDEHKIRRLTTDSLVLAFIIVAAFIGLGILSIDPVFRLLGAEPDLLPLIKEYMRIWYLGMIFVVVPMVGNNAIRATGDTKTPTAIMLVAVLINVVLDPLLIFGFGPFPRLELAGAAASTVISRATTFVVALWVLGRRERMLTARFPSVRAVMSSWGKILYIGLPSAATRMIVPIAIGIITRIVSAYGAEAVAAYGVASRIEFFALMVIMSLGAVFAPFTGQNWGAGRLDRVRVGMRSSARFSLLYGLGAFVLLAAAAHPVAGFFTRNPDVAAAIKLYLRIVPLGYGLQGVLVIVGAALNALNKPLHAAGLVLSQMIVIYVPLAYLGSSLFGLAGVFMALGLVYALGGIAGHFLFGKTLRSIE